MACYYILSIQHEQRCIVKNPVSIQAYRVRRCIPLQGEGAARGKALLAPLKVLDDALILVEQGRIAFIGAYSPKALPAGISAAQVHDLGDKTMLPAAINAHTHLQLSHLAGRTTWGQGFVPWLQSLIPQLALPFDTAAIKDAVTHMKQTGTAYFADYTSAGMPLVAQAAVQAELEGIFLAEWFGFVPVLKTAFPHANQNTQLLDAVLPAKVQEVFAKVPQAMQEHIVPCGHALYSTHAQTLQQAYAWCCAQRDSHKKVFALHLAEFPEEVQMLTQGTGALMDVFKAAVLPASWQAPGYHPVEYAAQLGILSKNTLAVHCVHCDPKHVQILEEAGAHVCLCPRSNAYLAVGTAPHALFMQSEVNICLGTDGLTSNTDVNVWKDAVHLQEKHDVPLSAVLRMLTVNGAAALGVGVQEGKAFGTLGVGAPATWVLNECTLM